MKVLVLNVRNLKQQEALFFFPHGWSKGYTSRPWSSLLTATESAGHTVGFVTPDAQLQQSRRQGVEGLARRGVLFICHKTLCQALRWAPAA